MGLHCLSFHLHLLDALLQCKNKPFHFYVNYGNWFSGLNFLIITMLLVGRAA